MAVVATRGGWLNPQRYVSLIADFTSGRVVAALAGAAIVLAITAALDGPTKLSRVVVSERDGTCVVGPLVAKNSDGIYLGDGEAHSIVSVSASDVRALVIERLELNVERSRVRAGRCPTAF